MRVVFLVAWLLAALSVRGVTPEMGKEKLRKLVRLPAVVFPVEWQFDPERGFVLGSGDCEARARISEIEKELTTDASDAERYESLGDLYSSVNDLKDAATAWSTASGLYRRRVELQPENGLLLAGFGRALQHTDRAPEAESILRRAVQIEPKQWRCWVALGRFLDSEARTAIYPPGSAPATGTVTSSGVSTDGPSPDQVLLAQKRMDEAGNCYDKAVAAAPAEAEALFRRGMHRCLRTYLLNRIRQTTGGGEARDAFEDCFSPESLADLQKASELSPRDCGRIGGAALFEIYAECARKGRIEWGQFSWDSLPDKSQRSIRGAITRLEGLAGNPETRVAARALEVLGILQGPVLHETRSCAANLQRALALDPSRDEVWDLLAATQVQAGHYEDLLSTCEDRTKQVDTAHSHLLLAKAFEKLRQWDNCEEEIRIVLKQDENNFTAALALGSLLMKRSDGDASLLAEANDWLSLSERILLKIPKAQRAQRQLIELTLSRSIYFALNDDLESARQWARAVIAADKNNQLAQEILAAMDY
jgi:tetratricopeptide (TPR) repeat protein